MKQFWIIMIIALSNNLCAQSTYRYGTLPSFNLSKKLRNSWKLDVEIESRQRFKRGTFGVEATDKFKHERVDVALVMAKKIGLNNKIAGGYLIRLTDKTPRHRIMEQLTLIQTFNAFRMAHRVAADQTFGGDDALEVRLRYRLGAEFPLNGLFVDPNEFYFKITHEYLNKFSDNEYDLEARLVPTFGYLITDTNKVEVALDYRIDSFIDGGGANNFWLGVNWYLKL